MEKNSQIHDLVPENVKPESCVDVNACDINAVPNASRKKRQAVLIIHGIGEQRPMDTLRGFVDALLEKNPNFVSKYRSKPDSINESLEMRCLQAPGNRNRPLTDYYEYYWANHMRDSTYPQVLNWLLGVLKRNPKEIPHDLKPVYFVSWLLLIIVLMMFALGFINAGRVESTYFEGLLGQKGLFLSGMFTLMVQWVGSKLVLGYVADAVRYLTPSPDNIEPRNKIRSEGIKLLRSLHDSGKYQRVIVVGHSLGSVIGYDIIRNLWVDKRKPVVPVIQEQAELNSLEYKAKQISTVDSSVSAVEEFQQYQFRLWKELREIGVPWLVTDFVTMGSPLAHAQVLMADSSEEFSRKMTQYEYPACPPVVDESPSYSQQYRLTCNGKTVIRSVRIPHHGAPFSCIRWTNLYFPYKWFVFGDLIGGPLKNAFGKGIRDIPVAHSTNCWWDRTLVSHVRYWAGSDGKELGRGEFSALKALRSAMRLDFLRGKSKKSASS
ncbi:MAG: hypothetical protein Q7T21_12540 [Gallionella sp.]|nr:hypothetical protein [Gallionella sp.]